MTANSNGSRLVGLQMEKWREVGRLRMELTGFDGRFGGRWERK